MGSDLSIWSRTKKTWRHKGRRAFFVLDFHGFEPIKVERLIRELLIMKRGGLVTPLEVNLISRDGRQGQDPALVGGSQIKYPQMKIEIWSLVENRVRLVSTVPRVGFLENHRFNCRTSSAVSGPKH